MAEPGDLVQALKSIGVPGGIGALGVLTGTTSSDWEHPAPLSELTDLRFVGLQQGVSLVGFAEVVLAGVWLALLFLYRLFRWPWLRGLDL